MRSTPWAACDVSAEMLEAKTPGSVTIAFIVHWEQTAFGDAERARQNGAARYDALDTIVQGKVVADSLDATARIACSPVGRCDRLPGGFSGC